MGCCNKEADLRPIGKARYYGGLALLGAVQAGMLVAVHALAVPSARYRKLLPFYRAYAADTLRGVWRRDDIRVGPPDQGCGLDGAATPSGADR